MNERATKAGLGRGLGTLMNGTKEPTAAASAPEEGPGRKAENLSPGMAALMRGRGPGQPTGNEEAKRPAVSPGLKLVRVSLVLADLLLVALAARLAIKGGGPLGFIGAALCVLAVGLGAWLFWLASRVLSFPHAQDDPAADKERRGD